MFLMPGWLGDLKKYSNNGHFLFMPSDNLRSVCNAPIDRSGVYVIYELSEGETILIYIGCSGKLNKDGTMFVRPSKLGGIKDRIVNGYQFGKNRRKRSWPTIMAQENIDALEIYWYATHTDEYVDDPRTIERKLLQTHLNIYGRLPKWNKKL